MGEDTACDLGSFSAPPGTRTRNLRIKSPLLCQIELEAHPASQPSFLVALLTKKG